MSKAIRIDSFSRDTEKNLYAMEMQNKNIRKLAENRQVPQLFKILYDYVVKNIV